jgi:hypothetical protein
MAERMDARICSHPVDHAPPITRPEPDIISEALCGASS